MKKVMVERVLFITIISIFLCSGVFAAAPATGTCGIVARADCDAADGSEGHIIMGLSSATNAHAEFPDTGLYSHVLCCNIGTGVTTCTGTNGLVNLSSSTNAHAELITADHYPIGICYEDFVCGKYSTCPENYIGFLSLTADTNAHIGNFSDYSTKICCGGTQVIQSSCILNSAAWNQDGVDPKVYDGTKVYLEITGSSECSGVSVAFNVEGESGSDPVTEQPINISFTGATARGSWYAEHQKCGIFVFEHDCEYSFTSLLTNNPEVSISSSEPIQVLKVSERDEDFCASANIQSCEDYDNEMDCSSDAGVCDVAKNNEIVNCNDDSIVCSCAWDSTAGTCGFGYTEISGGDDCDPTTQENCCEPGETLCADNVCKDDCGAIGDNCNGDGTCDATEGCSCEDCYGEQNNCDSGAICSENFGACSCNYGFTLCKNGEISYCNLGNTCPDGQSPTSLPENQNGSCDFGIDGCLSADCPEGSQDTCVLGTYCINDKCSSVEAPPVTLGNCKITQEVITDCEEGGGIKTIRITGTWTGEGTCGEACQKCNAMQDTPLTVPCPAQIQLPFFDYIGIITTVASIALIYVFLILRKKISKKKK